MNLRCKGFITLHNILISITHFIVLHNYCGNSKGGSGLCFQYHDHSSKLDLRNLDPPDKTHLDPVRGLIELRGFQLSASTSRARRSDAATIRTNRSASC